MFLQPTCNLVALRIAAAWVAVESRESQLFASAAVAGSSGGVAVGVPVGLLAG